MTDLAIHYYDLRANAPVALLERWNDVREWHLSHARAERENRGEPPIEGRAALDTEERMIRQRHSERLQEFWRSSKLFEELEWVFERALTRSVNGSFTSCYFMS